MARTYRISDGTVAVSLIDTSGFFLTDGGDQNLGAAEISRTVPTDVLESLTVKLKGSSQDNAASQIQTLLKLLRKADEYERTVWQTTPVYLEAQASNETSARYAILRRASRFLRPTEQSLTFAQQKKLLGIGLDLIREHPWRGTQPATLPSAETLTKTSGSADKTEIHVPTFQAAAAQNVATVKSYDSSVPAFGSNQVSATGVSLWSVSGSTPAAGDILYIGASVPWHHFVIPIATAGSYTADVVVEAYISGAWTELTNGTQFTFYDPTWTQTSPDGLFKAAGEWVLNVAPGANWQTVAVDGETFYWVRLRLNTVTTWTTTPVTHSTETMYTPRLPYFIIPSTAIGGDTFPRALFRLKTAYGGSTAEGMGNLSRIIMGAKSINLANFQSHINLGNAGNTGWTNSYGTDTSSATSTKAGAGVVAAVTFTSNTSLVSRVTLTGSGLFDDYRGAYRVYLIAEQVGGSAGDVAVKVRFLAGSSAAGSPYVDVPSTSVATLAADKGFEVIECGIVQIPFGPTVSADSLGIDLYIEVHAERTSGSATLNLERLVLIPIDEFYCEVDDNAKRDTTSGGPALRGGTAVDVDFDVLADRTMKHTISSSTFYPTMAWNRSAAMCTLQPATTYRVYCLLMNYPTTFGTGPLVSTPGSHLAVSLHVVDSFATLRGSG